MPAIDILLFIYSKLLHFLFIRTNVKVLFFTFIFLQLFYYMIIVKVIFLVYYNYQKRTKSHK